MRLICTTALASTQSEHTQFHFSYEENSMAKQLVQREDLSNLILKSSLGAHAILSHAVYSMLYEMIKQNN